MIEKRAADMLADAGTGFVACRSSGRSRSAGRNLDYIARTLAVHIEGSRSHTAAAVAADCSTDYIAVIGHTDRIADSAG